MRSPARRVALMAALVLLLGMIATHVTLIAMLSGTASDYAVARDRRDCDRLERLTTSGTCRLDEGGPATPMPSVSDPLYAVPGFDVGLTARLYLSDRSSLGFRWVDGSWRVVDPPGRMPE